MDFYSKVSRVVAFALIPAALATAAVGYAAWRPIEAPHTASVQKPVVVARDAVPATVELPYTLEAAPLAMPAPKAKPVAYRAPVPAPKPVSQRTVCEREELLQGTVGSHVLYCHKI